MTKIFLAALCLSIGSAAFAQVVQLSPTGLSFGNQLMKASSTAKSVTLTNTDPGSTLTGIAIRASGDFSQTNTCGTTVAPLGKFTISVSFTPSVSGALSGVITIADNAISSPQLVNLSGTGVTALSHLEAEWSNRIDYFVDISPNA